MAQRRPRDEALVVGPVDPRVQTGREEVEADRRPLAELELRHDACVERGADRGERRRRVGDDEPAPASRPDSSVAKAGGSSIHDDLALAPVHEEPEVPQEAAAKIDALNGMSAN